MVYLVVTKLGVTNMKLSKSLEDYLETIYNLSSSKHSASAKDIAEYMHVTLPSVNTAVKNLAEREYLVYKPYEAIVLTKLGIKKAQEIVRRHLVIRTFLSEILKLDYEKAEEEACNLEHAINTDTSERLAKLIEKLKSDPHFKELFESPSFYTLKDLKSGEKGTVISVKGEMAGKHRLIEMGITPGTELKVVRKAPLGDPIEIKIRGFLLSLRLSEAKKVIIQKN